MAIQIQLRRGTSSEWSTANPILAEGEIGFVTDTNLYKIGDGSTPWNSLSNATLSAEFNAITYSGVGSDPSTPASGTLLSYSKSIGGRMMPKIKGPSGLDTALQPSLFGNGMYLVVPGATTVMNVQGGPAVTVVGTASHPALATTDLVTQTSRCQILSAAGANSASEVRTAFARVYRGAAAGLGGFFIRFRFAIQSTVANQTCIIGLTSSTGATSTSQVPSALTNAIFVGYDSGDANFQIMYNDGAGTCSKIDLGSNFPRNVIDTVYDVTLFAAPNDSVVNYQVDDLKNLYSASGTLSTDLPSATTFLAPHSYVANGGTASAVTLCLMRVYIETDY